MTTHDPHTVAHDLATENHKEHERPKKSSNASHARCTTAIRRKTIDNIKSGHLITNVPEVLVKLWRSRRGKSRTWRCHRTGERIVAQAKKLEIHAVAALVESVHGYVEEDGTRAWTTNKGWTADKDRTTDWRETSTSRTRRRTKVSNPRNPTPGIILAVNSESDIEDYRTESISSTVKSNLGVDREIGLLRERNDIPLLRTIICKVQYPKTRKVGLLIYKAKNTKVIGRESRGVRSGCERAESESKQRIKPQAVTVRKRDSKNVERWSSGGETKKKTEKGKVELLREEPVPTEQFPRKEGSKTKGEGTRKINKAREVTKSHKRFEGGESRSLSENRIKGTKSASTYSDKEAKRLSKTRGEAKQLTSKLSGIHKPNLSRYKSISLSSKGAYYESPNCKRKQVNWEYIQICMSDWNLIKRCMIDRNLKLCVWN